MKHLLSIVLLVFVVGCGSKKECNYNKVIVWIGDSTEPRFPYFEWGSCCGDTMWRIKASVFNHELDSTHGWGSSGNFISGAKHSEGIGDTPRNTFKFYKADTSQFKQTEVGPTEYSFILYIDSSGTPWNILPSSSFPFIRVINRPIKYKVYPNKKPINN